MRTRRGFTLVELMITMAIVIVLAVVVSLNLAGNRFKADLDSTAKNIAATLREAQSNAMAGEQGVAWGVHFENATATTPFFALFASSTYATSAVAGRYPLPADIAYATATLAQGASLNVIFLQFTGAASASTSVRLYAPANTAFSSTLYITSSGAVSY